MRGRFAGKVAVVTGGNSGIGQTIALRFAAEGAKVVITGRNADKGADTIAKITAAGGIGAFEPADLTDESQVAAVMDRAVERFGRLDIASNNAGDYLAGVLLHETSLADYKRVMGIDLDAIFYCMKHQIRHFLAGGGGAVVNCGSTAAHVAIKGNAAYVGAKHGVVGLTKAAALDYATQNIRVNCVSPGATLTPMMKSFLEQAGPAGQAKLMSEHPIGRAATTDEVANLVLWLASDEASDVLGHTIPVDGGATIF